MKAREGGSKASSPNSSAAGASARRSAKMRRGLAIGTEPRLLRNGRPAIQTCLAFRPRSRPFGELECNYSTDLENRKHKSRPDNAPVGDNARIIKMNILGDAWKGYGSSSRSPNSVAPFASTARTTPTTARGRSLLAGGALAGGRRPCDRRLAEPEGRAPLPGSRSRPHHRPARRLEGRIGRSVRPLQKTLAEVIFPDSAAIAPASGLIA